MHRGRLAVFATCAIAASAPAVAARAARTLEDDPEVGYPARWYRDAISVELAAPADASLVAEFGHALTSAAETWAGGDCGSTFTLTFQGSREGRARPGDGVNTVELVTMGWTERGFPADRGATTELQLDRFGDGTVEIREADMYINLADHRFSDSDEVPEGALDVRAVVTHELGHVLGLLHVCEEGGASGAPACTPEQTREALYPDYVGTTARQPSADELAAICSLYSTPSVPCDPECAVGYACRRGECEIVGGQACDVDADCGDGRCVAHGEGIDTCALRGTFGTSCNVGTDCTSSLCLGSRVEPSAFCTRTCDVETPCPLDLVCMAEGGQSVCQPPSAASCSVSPRRDPTSPWATLLLAGVGISAVARRRRWLAPLLAAASLFAFVGCDQTMTPPDAFEAPGEDAAIDAHSDDDVGVEDDGGGGGMEDAFSAEDAFAMDAPTPPDAAPEADAPIGPDANLGACPTEGMRRRLPCACGVTRVEICAAGMWVIEEPCDYECEPGTRRDTSNVAYCEIAYEECGADCRWGEEVVELPAGRCRLGSRDRCEAPNYNCRCTDVCSCIDVPGCPYMRI